MAQPEPNSQLPEEQPTAIQSDRKSSHSPEELFLQPRDHELQTTRVSDPATPEDERGFSPSDDTLTAIDDLGLRLQPVPNHNVIGRMAHYEIIRCLGRGGMGTVFEAFDTKLFRTVAIKFMASSLAASSKARSRFLREARVAAGINHPNVVTIHSVDEYDGRPYLVMEFVSGTSLQEHLKKTGPMPLGEVLRIGRQIATGLKAAHEKGIVHRDIKPGNVLLENGVQRVKIVDFGLAQIVFELSDITSQGQTLGTPRYMSPEQIEGSRVDERADLFSLGCVLYMMCAGHPPFAGNAITVVQNILREPHVPIRQYVPEFPQSLSDLVDSLLNKKREDRTQSAAAVEERLMEITRCGTPSDEFIRVVARNETQKQHPPHRPRIIKKWSIMAGTGIMLAVVVLAWPILGPGRTPFAPTAGPKRDQSSLIASGPEIVRSTGSEGISREARKITVGGPDSEFPSLSAAISQVQPGDTLVVQGSLPANDSVTLNDPRKHSNVTIEWNGDSVLSTTDSVAAVITIESVPGVTIRGAKIVVKNGHAISVRGNCAGLLVEGCDLEQTPRSRLALIALWETAKGTSAAPLVFKDCRLTFFELGIAALGSKDSPAEWIRLEKNLIRGLQPEWGTALVFEKSVRHIQMQHNRIMTVRAGINVHGVWEQFTLRNNTFFDVIQCISDSKESVRTSIAILGNLAVECDSFAPSFVLSAEHTTYAFNKAVASAEQSSLADIVQNISFVSTDYASPDFLVPLANDQLEMTEPPLYIGAMAPQTTPASPPAARVAP